MKLEIVLAIPDSYDKRIETNNSGAQGLNERLYHIPFLSVAVADPAASLAAGESATLCAGLSGGPVVLKNTYQ